MEKYEMPKFTVIDLSNSISTALNGSSEGTFNNGIDASEDIF